MWHLSVAAPSCPLRRNMQFGAFRWAQANGRRQGQVALTKCGRSRTREKARGMLG